MDVSFVWDTAKDRLNRKKHGVSFAEAATIFDNFPIAFFADPDHSAGEDRYIALGVSRKERVLLVVHCESEKGTEIRIISARKATRNERQTVFGGGRP